MEPAFGGLDGVRAFAVFGFLDGVVVTAVNDGLFGYFGIGDVVDERPADAAAATGVDEAVLRAGVEGVFAVDKFRVEHYVALLRLAFQIREAFPVDEVAGAGDAAGCCGCREITGAWVIMTLYAEEAVDPAVFMVGKAHVIDVGGRIFCVRHGDGVRPEAEVVDAVGAFGHCEEWFAVVAFDTDHEDVFAVPLYGAWVESGVAADALHEVGVGGGVEVVFPCRGHHFGCDDRVGIALVDAVALNRGVGTGDEFLVAGKDKIFTIIEKIHLFRGF